MKYALMRSLNTVAVRLSLAVGREKLLANVHKIGHTGVKKTCSMALGDTGLTLLAHTGGFAVFASGGMFVKPYGIEEIRNSHGKILYVYERDAPKPRRIFELEKIEQLNSMLALVVSSGTGRRAQLPFTTAVGKTGTSSAWRDGWFMGFTGQYVAGTWFGNDNYSPTARVTGGNLPAMAWKEFMMFAHATYEIPKIPGVPLHPAQLAEQQRIASLRHIGATLGRSRTRGLLRISPETRKALEELSTLLKESGQTPLAKENQPRGEATVPRKSTSLGAPISAGNRDRRTSLR